MKLIIKYYDYNFSTINSETAIKILSCSDESIMNHILYRWYWNEHEYNIS